VIRAVFPNFRAIFFDVNVIAPRRDDDPELRPMLIFNFQFSIFWTPILYPRFVQRAEDGGKNYHRLWN